MKKKAVRSKAKAKKVKPVPAGYHTVTPYLACGDAARAIEFYKKAFGAAEVMRMPGPDGKIAHAEDIQHGLENAPKTFLRLFQGKNLGKQLLKVADPPIAS